MSEDTMSENTMSEWKIFDFDVGSSDADANVIDLNTTCDIVKDGLQFIHSAKVDLHRENVSSHIAQRINLQLRKLIEQCLDNFIQYNECSGSLQVEPSSLITRDNCIHLLATGNAIKFQIELLKSLITHMNRDDTLLRANSLASRAGEKTIRTTLFDETINDFLRSIKDLPKHHNKRLLQESMNMNYVHELEKQRVEMQIIHEQQEDNMENQPKPLGEYLVIRTRYNAIKQYDDDAKKWLTLMCVPYWVDAGTSWCACDSRIIIAGATGDDDDADKAAVLDIKAKTLKELPRLPAALHRPTIVANGDDVYIIGGTSIATCAAVSTMYHASIAQNNGWTKLPNIQFYAHAAVASCDSDNIYVFCDGDVKQTHIYNKHTQRWSHGTAMPLPTACMLYDGGCIHEGRKITIITTKAMLTYDTNDDSWEVVIEFPSYNLFSASAVSYKGAIVACGIHKENIVSSYNPESDELWEETDINVSDIMDEQYLFKILF